MKYRQLLLVGMCTLALVACGGGGGGGSDDDSDNGDNEPDAPEQGYSREHLEQINANMPQLAGMTGAGVRIAVLDSGVRADHEVFAERKINAYDTLADNGDRTYEGSALTDEDGHGTATAALAVGKNVGVAPDAELSVYKITSNTERNGGGNRPADMVEALEQTVADGGVDILNISFALDVAPSVSNQPIRDAVLAGMAQDDWILITSAGNTGGGDAFVGSAYADDPAFGGQYLAVGAVDRNNQISEFSSVASSSLDMRNGFGDVPGVLEHFLVAPGRSVCSASNEPVNGAACNAGSGNASGSEAYKYRTGTSFAAPQVAGAAALIKSEYPAFDGSEVVQILLDSATDLGDPGVDPTYGSGLLNVQAALELAEERATPYPSDGDTSGA